MKLTLTAASLALALSTNLLATQAIADEALLDGVRPFICNGEAVVLLETDNGRVIPTYPTAEVKPTDNGWRYEDVLNGDVWYLRGDSLNSWVVEGLSEDGYFTADCIDVAGSVSEVVTIIKPRLDEGIVETQQLLEGANQKVIELSVRLTEMDQISDTLQISLAELQGLQLLKIKALVDSDRQLALEYIELLMSSSRQIRAHEVYSNPLFTPHVRTNCLTDLMQTLAYVSTPRRSTIADLLTQS